MGILDALLLGILEGLTELLPVSSTGHLILLGDLLGHDSEGAKALEVVIQLGAVLAVAVYFRRRIAQALSGLFARDAASLRLVLALLAAFVPTAIVGLLLHAWVKAKLFGPIPVAGALIVGGVLMIVVERWALSRQPKRDDAGDADETSEELEKVTPLMGLFIGFCQCLSLWPGSSRSMTTIVGGQLCGLTTKTAAEFSFLLALPTLGAATVYDFYKNGHAILALDGGGAALAIGTLVSFLVCWVVVAVFLRYVGKVGMSPFGVYRIGLGALVLWLLT